MTYSCRNEDERKRLDNFSASRVWALNFVNRRSLRSVLLHREAGSASTSNVAVGINKLRHFLREYDVSFIFNVDEKGLFYKLLTRRNYISRSEDCKSVRGTKAMKYKERITAYV